MRTLWMGLVGDIGGTNARLALVDVEGRIRHPRTFANKDYASLDDVIADYLATTAGKKRPPRAVLAVAGPVVDGEIEFTNLHWTVSEGDLLAQFEFEAVELINDFAAQALACPRLEGADLRVLGPDLPKGAHDCPIVALGPGTGFGVAALARGERGEIPIATEGGHAGFAPSDEVEIEILKRMSAKYGRVSVERLLSGQGLYDLYGILAEMRGEPASLPDEAAVTRDGLVGDPLAGPPSTASAASWARRQATWRSPSAPGGVFVAGGIGPRIAERRPAARSGSVSRPRAGCRTM